MFQGAEEQSGSSMDDLNIPSISVERSAESLAQGRLEDKQQREKQELESKAQRAREEVAERSSASRVELLTSDTTTENTPGEWHLTELYQRLSNLSIAQDLSKILQEQLKTTFTGSGSELFKNIRDHIFSNINTIDADTANKLKNNQISSFDAYTIILAKLIAKQETKTQEELAKNKEIAELFQSTVETVRSLEEPKTESSSTQSPETGTSTTNTSVGETATTPETKKSAWAKFSEGIKEFFAVLMAKIGNFFNSLFKGKKNTPEHKPNETPQSPENLNSSDLRSLAQIEADNLNIDVNFVLAIMTVEAGKKPFGPNGMPIMRFEPHVFNGQLRQQGVSGSPGTWADGNKLVGRKVDGVSCEGGQAGEQACLAKAISINKEAAYRSISMGIGQIMGFNYKLANFNNAEEMFQSFSQSGGGLKAQLHGMFNLIKASPAILNTIKSKNFSAFTKAYNGAKEGSDLHSRYTQALQNAYYNHQKQGKKA